MFVLYSQHARILPLYDVTQKNTIWILNNDRFEELFRRLNAKMVLRVGTHVQCVFNLNFFLNILFVNWWQTALKNVCWGNLSQDPKSYNFLFLFFLLNHDNGKLILFSYSFFPEEHGGWDEQSSYVGGWLPVWTTSRCGRFHGFVQFIA